MFPTIVGAWVLDGGEAGRRRFCYPKGQSRAAALSGECWGLVRGYPRRGWNWGGRRRWRWSWVIGVGIEVETAFTTRRLQKPNSMSKQSLNTAVLVAGSCWLMTPSRWSAGLGLANVVVVVGRRRK